MWKPGDLILKDGVPGIVTDVKSSFAAYYHLENGTCGECLNELLKRETNMARPRKTAAEKTKAAEAKVSNDLLSAVQFCAGGYREGGETYASHAMIYGGYITTYSGVVMYGARVDTQLHAYPHYGLLLAALKATDGDAVQITQLSPERLSIRGKSIKTVVPCVSDHTLVARTNPDPPISALDNRMRDGFAIMKQIASKSGEYVMDSAVLIRNGDMIACDRQMLGMYWHGNGFPNVTVPADFVEAILKIAKPLVSFGYTPDQSLTFYFEDGSFVRTQLYADLFPDVSKAIPPHWNGLLQLPDGFFEALAKIKPFVKKTQGYVLFNDDNISTDATDDVGTVVRLPGLQEAPSGISLDHMLSLRGFVTHLDYLDEKKCRFMGPNFCGVVANFAFERPEDDDTDKGPADPNYDPRTFAHEEALGYYPAPTGSYPPAAEDPRPGAEISAEPYDVRPGFTPPEPVRIDNDPPAPEPTPAPQPAVSGGWVLP